MELGTTRKVLARIPDDKLGWKPHERSMSLGHLAGHIAEMHGWGPATLAHDEIDLAPPGGPKYETFVPKSSAELLARFDEAAAKLTAAIAAAGDDAVWMKPWSLKMAGETIMTMPKVACIRGMICNHIVHHRGQLSVYLRMLDIPVPSIYGPSADEKS